MEASQILCGLLEDSGGQLCLARLGDVIFDRFHLVDLDCSFLSQAFEDRHFRKCESLRIIGKKLPTREGDQNTEQRTGDGKPEGNAPAGLAGRASSTSMPIVCYRLHGTEPDPTASSIALNSNRCAVWLCLHAHVFQASEDRYFRTQISLNFCNSARQASLKARNASIESLSTIWCNSFKVLLGET